MDGNTENVFHDSRDDGSRTRRHLPQELSTQGFTTEVAENAINLDNTNFLFDDLPDDLIFDVLGAEGQTNIGSGTEFDVELENASNSMNVDESHLQAHDPLRQLVPRELGTQGFTTEVAENAINLDNMNFLVDDLPDDLNFNVLAEEGQQTNIGSGTEFDVELENASNSMNVDESHLQAHDPLQQLFNAQSQPHSNKGLQIPAAEEGQHGLQNQISLFNDQYPFNLYNQELPDPSHEGSLQNQIPTFNTQQVALHFHNETGNLLNLGVQELSNPNQDEGHTEEGHGGPQNPSQQQLHNQEPAVGVQNVNHEGPVHGQQADGADNFLRCGACAYSNAKCSPNCVFRPHFPSNKKFEFGIILNATGRSNLKKRVAQYAPQLRDTFFNLRYQEGLLTAKDDYGGCAAALNEKDKEIQQLKTNHAKEMKEKDDALETHTKTITDLTSMTLSQQQQIQQLQLQLLQRQTQESPVEPQSSIPLPNQEDN